MITQGNRDDFMFRFASLLRGAGLVESEIVDCLHVINISRCEPQLPDEVLEQKARSAARYERGEKQLIDTGPLEAALAQWKAAQQ